MAYYLGVHLICPLNEGLVLFVYFVDFKFVESHLVLGVAFLFVYLPMKEIQLIRVIDVVVIAPVCVYAGVKYYNLMPKWLSISLITIGVATAVYNGMNFYKESKGGVIGSRD